ncbi:MAG: hypothetical protein PUE12_17755 [Oscillospiraceae bacterium]|nr:hypothetical protein [Oscillospiraceae bacterium]
MDLELLQAKDAIFRLIGQFHHATKLNNNDNELYIYDNCESALERAFTVLGIKEDYIKLYDFCKMWEDNNRAIWAINFSNKPFIGCTADDYYSTFKEDYYIWERLLEDDYV